MNDNNMPLASIETYMPEDDEWILDEHFSLPMAMEGHQVLNLDETIFLIGGNASSGRVDPNREALPANELAKYHASET